MQPIELSKPIELRKPKIQPSRTFFVGTIGLLQFDIVRENLHLREIYYFNIKLLNVSTLARKKSKLGKLLR